MEINNLNERMSTEATKCRKRGNMYWKEREAMEGRNNSIRRELKTEPN
jgi:hypothetical protein